jgi:hypothetical protein
MSAEEEQLTCFCRALESRMVNKQFRTRCRRSSIIIRRCAVRIIMEPNSRWLENFQDLFEIVTFYRPSGRYLYGTKQNYWIMMYDKNVLWYLLTDSDSRSVFVRLPREVPCGGVEWRATRRGRVEDPNSKQNILRAITTAELFHWK